MSISPLEAAVSSPLFKAWESSVQNAFEAGKRKILSKCASREVLARAQRVEGVTFHRIPESLDKDTYVVNLEAELGRLFESLRAFTPQIEALFREDLQERSGSDLFMRECDEPYREPFPEVFSVGVQILYGNQFIYQREYGKTVEALKQLMKGDGWTFDHTVHFLILRRVVTEAKKFLVRLEEFRWRCEVSETSMEDTPIPHEEVIKKNLYEILESSWLSLANFGLKRNRVQVTALSRNSGKVLPYGRDYYKKAKELVGKSAGGAFKFPGLEGAEELSLSLLKKEGEDVVVAHIDEARIPLMEKLISERVDLFFLTFQRGDEDHLMDTVAEIYYLMEHATLSTRGGSTVAKQLAETLLSLMGIEAKWSTVSWAETVTRTWDDFKAVFPALIQGRLTPLERTSLSEKQIERFDRL